MNTKPPAGTEVRFTYAYLRGWNTPKALAEETHKHVMVVVTCECSLCDQEWLGKIAINEYCVADGTPAHIRWRDVEEA